MEDLREEFAMRSRQTPNFSELCREYHISRRTGYKWLERYEAGEKLTDRSRKPKLVSNKTPPETEKLIINLRGENPGWGAKKIREVLARSGHDMP